MQSSNRYRPRDVEAFKRFRLFDDHLPLPPLWILHGTMAACARVCKAMVLWECQTVWDTWWMLRVVRVVSRRLCTPFRNSTMGHFKIVRCAVSLPTLFPGTELLVLVAEKYVPLAAKLYALHAEIVRVCVNAINSLHSVEIYTTFFFFLS